MLPIEWRDSARNDLREIITYIAERDPDAAARLKATIEYATDRLSQFPLLYRPGRVAGTREAVIHPNYILIYRVGAAQVEILSVVHSRRQYPPESEASQ